MSALQKFIRLSSSATFVDALAALKETNASLLKITPSNDKDEPLAAAIFVRGKKEAAEILAAVQKIEDGWEGCMPATTNGNTKALAETIRAMADEIAEHDVHPDHAELLRVLARVIEGKTLAKSFGAPGDWGYGTPIGDALAGGAL